MTIREEADICTFSIKSKEIKEPGMEIPLPVHCFDDIIQVFA